MYLLAICISPWCEMSYLLPIFLGIKMMHIMKTFDDPPCQIFLQSSYTSFRIVLDLMRSFS